ncbi:MAG: GatB/YqeY domain-containing protein [bacterium]
MSLITKIDAEIKQAMLQKQEARLRGLRAIKAALLLAKTEKGASEDLSEEVEVKAVQKQIKQRKDSIEIYKQQNREDLAIIEEEEVAVMEEFLPKQLSADELRSAIQELVNTLGVTDIKEMGKVIGAANKALAGKSDGKSIADMVKQVLSK